MVGYYLSLPEAGLKLIDSDILGYNIWPWYIPVEFWVLVVAVVVVVATELVGNLTLVVAVVVVVTELLSYQW